MRGAKKQKTSPPEQADPGVPAPHVAPSPVASEQDMEDEGGQSADVRAERSADVRAERSADVRAERSALQQEALRLTEKARRTQAARRANATEYLRLAGRADGEQARRLERTFQAKDGRLSASLANQQARLGRHLRRLADLDRDFDPLAPPKAQAPESGLSKAQAPDTGPPRAQEMDLPKAQAPETGLTKAQAPETGLSKAPETGPGDRLSLLTDVSEDTPPRDGGQEVADGGHGGSILSLLEELAEAKEALLSVELRLKRVAEECGRDHTAFEGLKHENAYRLSQIQAQLNDLMDLHQNEVSNLQSELASLEEKIAYQSYESGRDIWEALESFQSKLTRLEQQQQQVSQAENLDGLSPRELLGKSMNLLLIAFTVVLMLMSTLSALVLPFIRTRARTVTTCAALLALVCLWNHWESFNPWPAREAADRRP